MNATTTSSTSSPGSSGAANSGQNPGYILGIDIGGTKLAVGVADAAGNLLSTGRIPTQPADGKETVLARLVDLCKKVVADAKVPVAAAGVGSVGPLDTKTGRILNPVNLPGWGIVPLVETLTRGLDMPVFLDNDGNAAGLGEHRFGAGRGVANMVYLTVSTGIGAGVVIDDRLYRGENGNAAELGHMSVNYHGVPCPCGNHGCIERYASGTAIARRTREALTAANATAATSKIVAIAGSIEKADTRAVLEALKQNDPIAKEIWDETILALGAFLANVIHSFNPHRIVIGGGVTHAEDLLFVPLREMTKRRAIPAMADIVDIVPAQLGDQVGVLGAVAVGQDGVAQRR